MKKLLIALLTMAGLVSPFLASAACTTPYPGGLTTFVDGTTVLCAAWFNAVENLLGVAPSKGGLLVGKNTTQGAWMAVGSDNQVLVASSSATNGVAWQSPIWLTTLNGSTSSTQTFATGTGLNITTANGVHTFTLSTSTMGLQQIISFPIPVASTSLAAGTGITISGNNLSWNPVNASATFTNATTTGLNFTNATGTNISAANYNISTLSNTVLGLDGNGNFIATTTSAAAGTNNPPTATSTAGEQLTAGDAVGISSTTVRTWATYQFDGANNNTFGIASQVKDAARIPGNLEGTTTVSVNLKISGSPSDNVIVSLQRGAFGSFPSSTSIYVASSSIVGSTINTTSTKYSFTLSVPQGDSTTTPLWIVVERSGALDGTNNYAIGFTTSTGALGEDFRSNGTSWTDMNFGMSLGVTTTAVVGNAYRFGNTGNAPVKELGFVGFAQSNTSSSNSVTIQLSGAITIPNGLATGTPAYQSVDFGNTTTTPSSTLIKYGNAIKGNSLVIMPVW